MTLRLVALMSVVLLLSLAAFGLLMGHYQKEFMDELPRTASAVGQATLRTLDWTEGDPPSGLLTVDSDAGFSRVARPEGDSEAADRPIREVRVRHFGAAPQGEAAVQGIRHIVTTSTEDNQFTIREHLVYPAEQFPADLPGHEARLQACLLGSVDLHERGEAGFFIDVDDVRAESDPMSGLVLTIPKFTPTGESSSQPGSVTYELSAEGAGAGADVFFARRDEIRLPIPLGEYQELFSKVRSRSMFLFFGVFLVGMVLSTGLATRFTRPIRQLDAGIRQLSAGDLDVQVEVEGKNEIGRLATAFNAMAGKLRMNRERAREMVRREKLSALGRLAAGVAHDVRNPLHSIGLTLQHLSEAARPEAEDRIAEFDRSVEVIRGEIRRLDELVGNFLRFAKSERQLREPVDLGRLTRETMQLVAKEAERLGVRTEIEVDEAVPAVTANAEAIRSALLNLVLNGLEAMPEGGSLTVRLSSDRDAAVLEVSDTGRGIPEDEQEHVFDFGYTTREGGHGLGLAIVHHCVVEEHGGRVGLESRPGAGTRVRLALPFGESEEA